MSNLQALLIGKIKHPSNLSSQSIETFRCGALHCGDQINGIDQKSFDGISLLDANTILRSCTGDFCRIEVTPASALVGLNIIAEPTPNRGERREECLD